MHVEKYKVRGVSLNIAIIKAGGIGNRMGSDIPKQFLLVRNKPIIIYTLEAFQHHPNIDVILVVCVDGWQDNLRAYAKKFNIDKLKAIVTGGATSLRSIKAGLIEASRLYGPDDMVVIHDGNRPLVSQEIISDVLAKASVNDAAVAAIPCDDEVMVSDEIASVSRKYLDHKILYRIQTPDAYRLGYACELFKKASDEQLDRIGATNILAIDMGKTVNLAMGSTINIRLTTPADIDLFKALSYGSI